MTKPYVLMILDGIGLNDNIEGNAFRNANTPNLNMLVETYSNTRIKTSGLAVGLPEGQMGNSEVGHTNIGAGRVVYQELVRITKEIEDGNFFSNAEMLSAIKHVKQNGSALHIYGLLSDGGVHSHINHLYGILKLAKINNVNKVYVHCFMDGRDTSPTSGIRYIKELQNKMDEIGVGTIATVVGRYYAMDRDNSYDRIKIAYDAITQSVGEKTNDILKTIEGMYNRNITDEFVTPIINVDKDNEVHKIQDNDSIIFFNYRPDRARQITKAIMQDDFNEFERVVNLKNIKYICMTQYSEEFYKFNGLEVAYKPEKLVNNFGEYISKLGMRQLRIAETQKYAHVTFFFNGGEEDQYDGEDRILIDSPKIATFDLKPEMSAYEITDSVINELEKGIYDAIIMNYANGDMVGHTGDYEATKKAVEAVDNCVGRVYSEVIKMGGVLLITADHGNAEQMVDYNTHQIFTQHTTFDVPFILVEEGKNYILREDGALCDICPTILDMMKIDKPKEMTGISLISK